MTAGKRRRRDLTSMLMERVTARMKVQLIPEPIDGWVALCVCVFVSVWTPVAGAACILADFEFSLSRSCNKLQRVRFI